MKIKSYAKVNLLLKVIGKLSSGYHELQMVNTKIDIYDEIEIIENKKNVDELFFENSNLNPSCDDLVIRSLKLVKEYYQIKDYFTITITKNIPIGAGLGGGSSNAAYVVRYLINRYNLAIDEKIIEKLSHLGADIPYFLYDGVCLVEGIGEKVQELPNSKIKEFVIVNPNIYVSTKEVFKNNKIISNKLDISYIKDVIANNKYHKLTNDLEPSAFEIEPSLKKIKEQLSEIGYVNMSGSGSTMMVFGENVKYIYDKCHEIFPEFYIKIVKTI